MTIFYDFEVNLSESEKAAMYAGNMGNALTEIMEFVRQRLLVLQDEIDKQEKGYTMTCVSSSDKFEIRHYCFDKELGQKMMDCVSQQDHDYLALRVWEAMYPGTTPPTN